MNQPTIRSAPTSSFRLLRYFTLTSLAAFVLLVALLMYLAEMGEDLIGEVLLEQETFFSQKQDDFAKYHIDAARRDLLTIHEADNINLTRLFANVLWQKDFAPLVAAAQRIPVEPCRAIADSGEGAQPREKKACYEKIGGDVMALPEFRVIDAKVSGTMRGSTVFKIKVYDLRGITVYSSEHAQIGEDKLGNPGWASAMAGKPASKLTHRDTLNAFEGVVENRDLIEIYIPAKDPGGENVVGVFEIYSDVTPFLEQINRTTIQIEAASADNWAKLQRAATANKAKADKYATTLLTVVLGLLALLYYALFLIVRNGQRILEKEKAERTQAEQALAESEARFRSLTAMSSDFYWESGSEHLLTQRSASKREAEDSVFHQRSPIGKRRWDIPYLSPDESGWHKHRAMLDAHLPFRDFEVSRLAADGAERHVSVSGDPVFNAAGEFVGYRGVGADITERKRAEADLRIAATAFEAQEGMFVTDAGGVILRVNRAFTEITGYTAADTVGQTPRLLRSGRHDASFYRALWDSILGRGTWKGEIWNRRKSGEVYPAWLTITTVRDGTGSITHYVATVTDITRRKAAEDEIRNLAFYDPLTQLPNRRLLMDRLQQALASSARSQRWGALLFIDLDHFKQLNDTLGHDKGDLLLLQVGQRLGACVREYDTVARLGGDEFVVMLENLSSSAEQAAAQTKAVAEKILATFDHPYQLAGHPYRNSGSIGIALFCGKEPNIHALLKYADIAMYQAKAAGRNALCFFDPGMQSEAAGADRAEPAPATATEPRGPAQG